MSANLKNSLFTVFLLLFSVSIARTQTTYAEQFEKAKYQMETRGDLQNAILQFEEIIQKYPDQKEYGARSQYYIGLCYEKLGYQEAKKAYQKVIANYPSEEEIVILAKDRLSELESPSGKETESNKEFQLQQVWARPLDDTGMPSPNGRLLSYVNWNVPCLSIYDFETRESKEITSTKGEWGEASIWPENSIWSPDGKKLAYVWYGEKNISIRVIGIDSSEPEEIYSGETSEYAQPYTWSSDGKLILTVFCLGDEGHEIGMISLEDHSVKILKKLEGGSHPFCSLSPDGRTVAYSYTPDLHSPQTDIYLINIEDGTETTLVDHPSTDFTPLWMPDGNTVIFFSDRTGTVGVWSQKIKEGNADGEEKLVKNLNRMDPKGITNNGELFMTFHDGGFDIYGMVIDPVNATVVSGPERIVETNIGWNGAASYSPDGKSLAYVSQRGVLNPQISWGQQNLVIRDLESGKERVLVPKLKQLVGGAITAPCWSPDGDEIVVTGRSEIGHNGAFIINLEDASVYSLLDNEPFIGHEVIWSDNKNFLYYRINGIPEKNGLYKIDRISNTQSIILAGENIQELSLHPDGKLLALSSMDTRAIKLFNLETSELRELVSFPEEVLHTTIAWSPDGAWLYMMKCLGKDQKVELWRMNPEGEDIRLIDDSLPHFRFLALHPDGRRIVFTTDKMSGGSSLWVMKNFLSDL
jgi:Tol biopolymer transport system component